MKYLNKVVFMDSIGGLWTIWMNSIPRLGERLILKNKLYTVTNVTWVLDTNRIDNYCNIYILEI